MQVDILALRENQPIALVNPEMPFNSGPPLVDSAVRFHSVVRQALDIALKSRTPFWAIVASHAQSAANRALADGRFRRFGRTRFQTRLSDSLNPDFSRRQPRHHGSLPSGSSGLCRQNAALHFPAPAPSRSDIDAGAVEAEAAD